MWRAKAALVVHHRGVLLLTKIHGAYICSMALTSHHRALSQVESAPDSPASKVMVGHQGPVWTVCCIDGGLCASAGADKSILLWDLNGPKVLPNFIFAHSNFYFGKRIHPWPFSNDA
jgi:WD40 repeat protein